MSPPRIFIPDLSNSLHPGKELVLDKKKQHYLDRVLRGKSLKLEIICNKKEGYWLAHKEVGQWKVKEFIESKAENISRSFLAFGVPKKNKLAIIFEKATELGVSDFLPIDMRFSQKPSSKYLAGKRDRLCRIIEAAACQSKRNVLPVIHPIRTLSESLSYLTENSLNCQIFFLHPGAGQTNLNKLPFKKKERVIFIGPEGGFSMEELELLRRQEDACEISLGSRILRLETAIIATLSWICYF
ncbi:RsmE family RNA methyltransferase [Candidatus Riflebacteria bacterium]